MKKKWIISAGAALALVALGTVAVAGHGGKMRGHWQPGPWMLERLDLTDEQEEQLQGLRKKHGEARREQREAMAAMAEEQREAVMNILTGEQQETLKEMRGRRGRFFEGRGGKGRDRFDMWRGGKGRDHAGRRGMGAFSRLDLTDEQKEQLEELRTGHREEMRETRQKHRTALENVLTDEQRQKLEEMKDDAFYGGGRRWRGRG